MNHEKVRDIRSARREGEIGAAVGESGTIPRYVSCSQSRTFPIYIALYQLHSHLQYISKSHDLLRTVCQFMGKICWTKKLNRKIPAHTVHQKKYYLSLFAVVPRLTTSI